MRAHRETFNSPQDRDYAKLLEASVRMRWNMLVNTFLDKQSGRTIKLDHLDVLEASRDRIVAGDRETGRVTMTFHASDIMRQGKTQLTDFEIRYFDDKGVEIRSKHSGMEPDEHWKMMQRAKGRDVGGFEP